MQPLRNYFSSLEEVDDNEVIYSKNEDVTHIIPPEEKKKINIKVKPKNEEETLFKLSKTREEKKETWLHYYRKAQTSKKQNSIVYAMRKGKFTINEKDEVVILPDLDISGNSKELLEKKWLKNKL